MISCNCFFAYCFCKIYSAYFQRCSETSVRQCTLSIGIGNSLAAKLRTDSGSDLGSVLVSSLPLADDDDERDQDDHDKMDCDQDNGNYDDIKVDNCGSDPNSLVVSSPEAPCTLFLTAPHFLAEITAHKVHRSQHRKCTNLNIRPPCSTGFFPYLLPLDWCIHKLGISADYEIPCCNFPTSILGIS